MALVASIAVVDAADTVRVISNTSVSVNSLSRGEVRSIFSMRMRQLPDGTAVTIFVLPDQDTRHAIFARQILNVLPYVLRDTWDRQVFTGTGKAPVVVDSQDELVKAVAQTAGGIGYIVGSDGFKYDHVKTLQVY